MTTANTIYSQLGGNKFTAMTGTYNFVDMGNGLAMTLRKNNANAKYLTIKLNASDLYEVEFFSLDKNLNKKIKQQIENVSCDMLQNIFTKITGLNVKL